MPRSIRTLEAGGQRHVLREEGARIDILLGNVVLLSSAALETERAFGALVHELVPGWRRVLVGGLGLGATLHGVLDAASTEARIVLVEKVDALVDLARNEFARFFASPRGGHVLDGSRVSLVREDVAEVVARERGLDAILLDVDNGPEWASFRTNARLYAPPGLAAACTALVPGGVFAVWSGYPADAFVAALRRASFVPTVHPLRERGVVRARAYVGRRPA
jgi:spermidine synthase